MDSRCSENREGFYVGWWPIKGAKLVMGRLKCLSVQHRYRQYFHFPKMI